jgi:hypothetical protein
MSIEKLLQFQENGTAEKLLHPHFHSYNERIPLKLELIH